VLYLDPRHQREVMLPAPKRARSQPQAPVVVPPPHKLPLCSLHLDRPALVAVPEVQVDAVGALAAAQVVRVLVLVLVAHLREVVGLPLLLFQRLPEVAVAVSMNTLFVKFL
jgi:hypothetical protein